MEVQYGKQRTIIGFSRCKLYSHSYCAKMSRLFTNFRFYLRIANETLYSSTQRPLLPFEFVILSSVRK